MLTHQVVQNSDMAGRARGGGAKPRPHAVVIGSGFGGLSAAVRLGARGWRVTVLEKLDQLGGRARAHRQDGYVFDAGPTIITAPFLLDELWALCGRRFADEVDLRLLDPFYTLRFHDGDTLTVGSDHAAVRAEIARISPEDVAGYDRYMDVSKKMYVSGFEGLSARPFTTLGDMASVVPELMRRRADRSIYALAKSCFRHPKLRIAFSFHPLFVGGNPMTASSFYSMIGHMERAYGVGFAMGGTGRLIEGLASLARGQGAMIRTGAGVAAIETADGAGGRPKTVGVRLESGERVAADIIVSNADTANTYLQLAKSARRRRWSDRSMRRAKHSMSVFVWYFGTTRRWDEVPHHTIVLGPRYEGLLKDIFRRKRLAKDFSLYLHRPTATDPSLAPEGGDAFYALSPVPNLASGDDWEAQAEPYRRAIERRLEETVLPGLGASIASSKIATPLTFRDELSSHMGAAFGLEPILTQMAWFRPHNRSEDVDGLYLVGGGTHPGAGVPGVISSAKVLDQLVPHGSTVTPSSAVTPLAADARASQEIAYAAE